MLGSNRPLYRFADLEVDPLQGSVRWGRRDLTLRPKTLQVLVYLIERRDRVVTKEELIRNLWNDTAVTDDALVQCIVDLRKALEDAPRRARFVRTLPRQGYRFIAPVDIGFAEQAPSGAAVIQESEISSFECVIKEDMAAVEPAADSPATRPAAGQGHRPAWRASRVAAVALLAAAAAASAVYFARTPWRSDEHAENAPLSESARKKGDAYSRLGRYRAAQRQYARYLQVAPSDWDRGQGYYRLALLHWKRGDLENARAAARREQQYHGSGWSAFLMALDRNEVSAAEGLKARVLASLPTTKLLSYFRGYYALKTGNAEEALRLFREAAARPPLVWNVDGIEDCLADAYLELGRLDEGVTEYRRLLEINPRYAMAHYRLGQAHERKGSPAEARTHYRRFLEIWKDADPDIPEVIASRERLAALR